MCGLLLLLLEKTIEEYMTYLQKLLWQAELRIDQIKLRCYGK